MDFEVITIRCAENKDIKGIWDLLHADCKGWSMEMISGNLDHMLVLAKHDQLLGVLYGELAAPKVKVIWIVIHPFYPQEDLKKIFIHTLRVQEIGLCII